MSEPYAERLVKERQELEVRVTGLTDFIAKNAEFATLHILERQRLRQQLYHMTEYFKVLTARLKFARENGHV